MSLEELNALAEKARTGRKQICVRCCMSAGCISSQADEIKTVLEKVVAERNLGDKVEIRRVGCMGFCGQGPLVGVDHQDGKHELLEFVKPEDVPAIVASLKGGKCDVSGQNRTRCKGCRLRKCDAIGMSKSGKT